MASTFDNIIDMLGDLSGVDSVKLKGDNTNRGAFGSGGSGGIYIDRLGNVSGSGASTITLEGGSGDWDGALSDEPRPAYYTRAQLAALSSITKHLETRSNAVISNLLYDSEG
jgi:hypothetical protein